MSAWCAKKPTRNDFVRECDVCFQCADDILTERHAGLKFICWQCHYPATYRRNTTVFGYIYRITNKKTKQVYIGQTIRSPFARWQEHFVDYMFVRNYSNRHALKVESDTLAEWTFEIIEEVVYEKGDQKKLNELEMKHIKSYDREMSLNTTGQTLPPEQKKAWKDMKERYEELERHNSKLL